MKFLTNRRGVAVVMLLIALPLLLMLMKATVTLNNRVQKKKQMREHCFTESLSGLQSTDADSAANRLALLLPDCAVSIKCRPDAVPQSALNRPRSLVFNLKCASADIDCGARALRKGEEWQYEITLDKF